MKAQFVRNALHDRLGIRLVVYSLLISTVLSAFAAGIQLTDSYQRQKDGVADIFQQIEQALTSPLEKALWKFDFGQVDVILDGIYANDAVAKITLESVTGEYWQRGDGEVFDLTQSNSLVHSNPNGDDIIVGTLTTFLSLDDVNSRIWAQFWTLVASNLVKAYISASCLLLLFYVLVAKPMKEISAFVSQNRDPDKTLVLSRGPQSSPDDLDQIVSAINKYNLDLAQKLALLDKEIVDRKATEAEAKQALEIRKVFLANMSHEVRTPLNAIIGLFQLIRMSEVPKAQKKQAQVGLEASYHLLSQLVNVLEASRIEADAIEIYRGPTKLAPLVTQWGETANAVRQRLDRTLDVVLKVADDLPETVHADARRLTQIVDNLTDNALKFTTKGMVQIEVRMRNEDVFEVSVSDTGCGIQEDMVETVFQRFMQADSAPTRENSGSGLGLSISRELAERMGGELKVTRHKPESLFSTTMTLSLKLSDRKLYARKQESLTCRG